MCDAPAQPESAEPIKTKKGFHPLLACAASTRSYISMGNTHTHYDSTLIKLSPSSQEMVRWWRLLSPSTLVPVKRLKLWRGCQVQDKQPATEKKRKVECAGLILSVYIIFVCFLFFL